MKITLLLLSFFIATSFTSNAQTYFPPLTGSTWETTTPESLGWCQDSINSMYNWLESTNTKAFMVLKDGRIVLERYFGTFTVDSFWVWNSAGKTLTAYAVGIAQSEGLLSINDTSSSYLGNGWTNATLPQEQNISILNQLTMTSGLDDGAGDPHCTDPVCLNYLADPGTRWAYHNGPYTLLDGVIETATGSTLNTYVQQKISSKIGMQGFYFQSGFNNVFVSRPRSMARFGLLLSQNGEWNGTSVLNDLSYINAMRTPSQSLNQSYGYLTWLNGQSSFMIPTVQFSFPGPLLPNAPMDLYAAIGKDAQIINVVPSQKIVLIRMGTDPNFGGLVSVSYNDEIWQYMNRLSCGLSVEESSESFQMTISPNPSASFVEFSGLLPNDQIEVLSELGIAMKTKISGNQLDVASFSKGIYFVKIVRGNDSKVLKLVVN